MPAAGALRRTKSRRVYTGLSPRPRPCSGRSPATSRRLPCRGRPRSCSVPARRARPAGDDPGPHRARGRRVADQHVAHPRRREVGPAAKASPAPTDPAVHRPSDRADQRRDPRGARQRGARVGDVRRGRWRRPRTGTSRTPTRSASRRLQPGWAADDTLLVAKVTGRTASLRNAVQLRLPPDDPGLGEPTAVARLHRRRPEVFETPSAPPCSSRAPPVSRPARRLRRRHSRRRPQRTTARSCRGRGDREPAAARNPLHLHGESSRPAPTSVPGSTSRSTPASCPRAEHLAARVDLVPLPRKEDIGVVESLSEEPGLGPGAREGAASPLPEPGARRQSGLRDAGLDLAARRRAAGRCPQRALLGFPGRAAAAPRRTFLLVLGVTNRTMGCLSPEETYGTGSTRSSSRRSAPGCLDETLEVQRACSRRSDGYRRSRGLRADDDDVGVRTGRRAVGIGSTAARTRQCTHEQIARCAISEVRQRVMDATATNSVSPGRPTTRPGPT